MDDKIQQIKALAELLKSNAISQEEFDSLKNELLSSSANDNVVKSESNSKIVLPSSNTSGKIVFENSESLIKEGGASLIRSFISVTQGTAYLTSQRFVFCKRGIATSMAVLGVLSFLTNGKNIVFGIELSNIRSISTESHGFSKKYIFKNMQGDEYAIQFLSNTENWLLSIQEAIKSANPSLNLKVNGKQIDCLN